MRGSYSLPKGEADAWRSKTQVALHFGEEAIRTTRIRDGSHWNKVEVQASVDLHERAEALSYLGLLDVTRMASVS